ncbi:MAG: DNA-directed RNA polymerase subunit A' [Candidatus Aenigmatarchaeota archaeon]|nr:MAG: DNA-directed RNA polymerase subunit A' [Candidatus Aenigmarchaeota archaeon]
MVTTNRISEMGFSLLSPEVIKNLARVRVVVSDLYDADGYPVEGGVMDPRLGVIDPGLHCRTCGGGIGDCPGHFGYLELAKPIINVLYTKTIYQILKLTCRKCNRLMIEDKKEEILTKTQLTAPSKCPHCKAQQKKITLSKPYTFYEDKTELTAADVRERFEKIPNRDLKRVGFNGGRPEWLILTLFPVPPVTMRPSITLEGGERSEDDLTHKLVDIVRINQSLKENMDIGAPEFILNDLWELVQYHISTYFDNELTGVPLARHRSGRALKGIIQRLKAKEGRIRGNLLGKRVNFSARTVISPDPKISINEVGVPQEIASELTVPVYVTDMNTSYVKQLFKDDKINYVIRPDGRRIKVTKENKSELTTNIGIDWVVDRQLKDGDIVLFNRQPSLHRVSMMAHRVRIMPYRTLRLNPSVCIPYNADFDGDEMNIHVPQNEEARTEASFLMEVQRNIISPKFGGPIIGLDLDQISGVYLLTKENVKFNRQQACQLFSEAGIDMELPDKEEFTGKELFSLLLPDKLNIEYKANACMNCDVCKKHDCPNDGWVSIKNGQIETGVIDKKGVGAEKGRLLNKLSRLLEDEDLRDFIDYAGRLGVAYLMRRGFSLGTADLDIKKDIWNDIRSKIDGAHEEASNLIKKYKTKELRILPGMTAKESLEAQIMNVLASGVSGVSDIIKDTMEPNDIIHMFTSGAKGNIINTTQMAAVVGQETILGKRIKRGYLTRTLPHIKPRDLSPGAHGFVSRGFKQGLTPFELFWNIMNGREGLMDKSLRTRKSGYMQRRLVNALQDLKVHQDGSVRNSIGEIVQFMAGEDGIDPSKSDWGKLNWKEGMR